jgi:hypothetical protein
MAAGALVEEVAEEVATNLEEVAAVTRRVDARALGYLGIGIGVGFALGFYWGYKFNREKIQAEVLKEAEDQIDQIREMYRAKATAAEPKPELVELIEERGYSTRETAPEPERALRPPVPIVVTPPPIVVIEEPESTEPDWIWAQELANRDVNQPYIIHEDEWVGGDKAYNQTQYTYWAGDDVLTDTDNTPIAHPNQVVGRENLRFGHGAGDPNIVFVRNDRLELDIEIDREPGSFEEEVLGKTRPIEDGLEHSDQKHPARKRKHNR